MSDDDPERLDAIERLADLYEDEEMRAAWAAVLAALERWPGDPELETWKGLLLIEDRQCEEALKVLDQVLRAHPTFLPAALERIQALLDRGDFRRALEAVTELEENPPAAIEVDEQAELSFDRALCLDRLGRHAEADAAFVQAASADPERFRAPARLDEGSFERLVTEALDSIPAQFDEYLRQVSVAIREYPEADFDEPAALGLYVGVPRTERVHDQKDSLDQVFVFKRNLEISFPDAEELADQVRRTVVHEIAHHFGLDEDDMGEYA